MIGRRGFKGAGVLMAHRHDDGSWQVLLFRRAIQPDLGRWSVLGGRQEPGESPAQTALREAVEEAFSDHRPEMFEEKLAGYLPERFDISSCPSTQLWLPGMFHYQTFLVELTREVPLEVFTPNWESNASQWFPADHLPPDAHRAIPWTVRRLGLVGKRRKNP
jgi:8-oxo-dGTP pyrophosphatase MutT (NUDIX family)